MHAPLTSSTMRMHFLTEMEDVMKNVTVHNEASVGSDHSVGRHRIKINLVRERSNFVRKSPVNFMHMPNIKSKFEVRIQMRQVTGVWTYEKKTKVWGVEDGRGN